MTGSDGDTSHGSSARGYQAVDLTPDHWDQIIDLNEWGFLSPWLPEQRAAMKSAFSWGRASGVAVADEQIGNRGTLAAIRCSYPFAMTVPGGERVPTSGLSWVVVHPGHRRRGILSAMMREHFAHALERGEFVSLLTASEPEIYQRFGYGAAAKHVRARFSRGAKLRKIDGVDDLQVRLERLTREDHLTLMQDLQRRATQPGAVVREGEAITQNLFGSQTNLRPETEPQRIAVVVDTFGTPQAFAEFRRTPGNGAEGKGGEVTVFNFVTTSAASSRRLWGVLFDLDLTSSIVVMALALDDPLLWLVVDQRAPKPVVEDDLWLRILDVPRALEARTYDAPLDLSIEVTDQHIGANAAVWRITTLPMAASAPSTATGLRASVTRVDRRDVDPQGDLSIGIQELSAAYLGGATIFTLAQSGLVQEHTPGAVRSLSLAMRSHQEPMSLFHF